MLHGLPRKTTNLTPERNNAKSDLRVRVFDKSPEVALQRTEISVVLTLGQLVLQIGT